VGEHLRAYSENAQQSGFFRPDGKGKLGEVGEKGTRKSTHQKLMRPK